MISCHHTSIRSRNVRIAADSPLAEATFLALGARPGSALVKDSSRYHKDATVAVVSGDVAGDRWTLSQDIGRRCFQLNGTSYWKLQDPRNEFSSEATLLMRLRLREATPTNVENTGLNSLTSLWTMAGVTEHYPYTDGRAYLNTFRTNRLTITPSTSVDRANWHTIAVTTKAGGLWKFYQNSILVCSTSAQSSVALPSAPYIGLALQQDGARYLNADLSDVALIPRELSAAEVAVFAGTDPYYNGWLEKVRRLFPASVVTMPVGPSRFPWQQRRYRRMAGAR